MLKWFSADESGSAHGVSINHAFIKIFRNADYLLWCIINASSWGCLMWECLGVNWIFYSEIILNVSCQHIYLFGEMSCNNLVIRLLSQNIARQSPNTHLPRWDPDHPGWLMITTFWVFIIHYMYVITWSIIYPLLVSGSWLPIGGHRRHWYKIFWDHWAVDANAGTCCSSKGVNQGEGCSTRQ